MAGIGEGGRATLSATINDVSVALCDGGHTTSTYYNQFTVGLFRVKAGDVLTTTCAGGTNQNTATIYFYPNR